MYKFKCENKNIYVISYTGNSATITLFTITNYTLHTLHAVLHIRYTLSTKIIKLQTKVNLKTYDTVIQTCRKRSFSATNGFEDPRSVSELSADAAVLWAGCAVGRISTFLPCTVTISGYSIFPVTNPNGF